MPEKDTVGSGEGASLMEHLLESQDGNHKTTHSLLEALIEQGANMDSHALLEVIAELLHRNNELLSQIAESLAGKGQAQEETPMAEPMEAPSDANALQA